MAAAQILSVANTTAASSDVTITAATTVSLKTANGEPPPEGCVVLIKLKDDNSKYNLIDAKLTTASPSLVITGPGVYQFIRQGGQTVGVFSG